MNVISSAFLAEYPPKRRLLDQVRDALRLGHYSLRTEETYVHWIRRFILFHDKRHPKDMAGVEIKEFLTYRAAEAAPCQYTFAF